MHYQYTWIRSFHYVAKIGNITKAAEQLGLSGSTLSHQITDLEKYFKVKLFHRSSNRILLTNIGASLKKKTDLYFEQEEEIKKFLAKVKNRVNKVVNVGGETPAKIIQLIEKLEKQDDKITFNLFFERNDQLWDMFFRNKVDIMAMNEEYFHYKSYQKKKDFSDIKSIPFYTDELVFIASSDYDKTSDLINFEELIHTKVLLNHRSTSSLRLYKQLMNKLELKPKKTMGISSRIGLLAAVEKKLGVAVMLKSELEGYLSKKIKVYQPSHPLIEAEDLEINYHLYFHRNISEVTIVKKFVQTVRQTKSSNFPKK